MQLSKFSELVEHAMRNNVIRDLMKSGWTWKYSKGTMTFGMCTYSKKTLSFSKLAVQYLKDEDITDTIYHEVAHALDEKYSKHGSHWKKIFKTIYPSASLKATRTVKSLGVDAISNIYKFFLIEKLSNDTIAVLDIYSKKPTRNHHNYLKSHQIYEHALLNASEFKEYVSDPTIKILIK